MSHRNDRALTHLFANNQAWAAQMQAEDPAFFSKLAHLQTPEYLWIGCSDSRVPANEITGLLPGEIFVHRNIANVVVHTDLNCLSVLQFAIDVLKVRHIMVVGHYGCGGVRAALEDMRLGLADNWLRHIQDVRDKHRELLASVAADKRIDKLCELNAVEQAMNIGQTTLVRDAWARGQALTIHAWVYGLSDGLVRDLGLSAESVAEMESDYRRAIELIASGAC
ncbi:MAG: carbonate dehydratase [Rhodocyclaceae bacterium]|jgi:carbonic anhydrase|nr:carbonate dehydratase [Rhodocyclaceae bacterium]